MKCCMAIYEVSAHAAALWRKWEGTEKLLEFLLLFQNAKQFYFLQRLVLFVLNILLLFVLIISSRTVFLCLNSKLITNLMFSK